MKSRFKSITASFEWLASMSFEYWLFGQPVWISNTRGTLSCNVISSLQSEVSGCGQKGKCKFDRKHYHCWQKNSRETLTYCTTCTNTKRQQKSNKTVQICIWCVWSTVLCLFSNLIIHLFCKLLFNTSYWGYLEYKSKGRKPSHLSDIL